MFPILSEPDKDPIKALKDSILTQRFLNNYRNDSQWTISFIKNITEVNFAQLIVTQIVQYIFWRGSKKPQKIPEHFLRINIHSKTVYNVLAQKYIYRIFTASSKTSIRMAMQLKKVTLRRYCYSCSCINEVTWHKNNYSWPVWLK